MAEINQTAAEKMYTVSSRETIYEGNGKDTDVNPLCDSDTWYEGAGRVEALRTVREYTADVRDMGKVEVCERGIARNVFEVCETLLDEDGDVIGENTIEIVDPLDRMPELREFADKAEHCNCQFPSYITGECKWIDDVEFDGKCYGLYRFEHSAWGDFSAYTDNGGFPPLSMISTLRPPNSSRKYLKMCAASGGRTGRLLTSSTRLSTSSSRPSANAQLEHFETGAFAWSHPSLRKA